VRVAVISDTHMPKGGRELPPRCLEEIAASEALIHAGDVLAPTVLERLRKLTPELYAVHGNVDEPALRDSLPERMDLELEGRRIGLVHDAGPARGRLARLRSSFPAAEAVVFGHSHLPLHESEDGFQIFNPGSPTERRRAPRASMGLLTVEGGGLAFEHVWL
jgi:putative phosphoesterase